MKKIIIVCAAASLLSGCWVTERGEKIGTLVKVNKQGIFIGTHEAELIRGGMNNGSGSFGKPFDFTIENENDLDIAKEALEQQKAVKIKYHKEGIAAIWRTETRDNSFLAFFAFSFLTCMKNYLCMPHAAQRFIDSWLNEAEK